AGSPGGAARPSERRPGASSRGQHRAARGLLSPRGEPRGSAPRAPGDRGGARGGGRRPPSLRDISPPPRSARRGGGGNRHGPTHVGRVPRGSRGHAAHTG